MKLSPDVAKAIEELENLRHEIDLSIEYLKECINRNLDRDERLSELHRQLGGEQ